MIIFADRLEGTSTYKQHHMVWVERESVPSSLCVCVCVNSITVWRLFFHCRFGCRGWSETSTRSRGFHYVHGKHWHLSSTNKPLVCFQQRKLLSYGGYNCFQQTLLLGETSHRWQHLSPAFFPTIIFAPATFIPSIFAPIFISPLFFLGTIPLFRPFRLHLLMPCAKTGNVSLVRP